MNQKHLQNVLQYMKKEQLNQIIVTAPAAVFYLTGQWIEPHERMLALYIRDNGMCILFANKLFVAREDADYQLIEYNDTDNPVELLSQQVLVGRLGVDKWWPSRFLIRLLELRKDIEPIQGSAPVDTARRYKDQEELDLLRNASRINDAAIGYAFENLTEGMSELDLCKIVATGYDIHGAPGGDVITLSCFGKDAAEPHHESDATKLSAGDCVLIDTGKAVNGYYCDMTRTVFYKEVSTKQRKVYDLVVQANLAGISAVKPGVPLWEIDRAARKVIEAGGYGQYFTHRLGHGIGLEMHEPPDVSAASTAVAEVGMTFSIEPGIYLPGEFGIRIEDLVIVTENGVEVMNRYPKELIVLS